MYVVIIIMSNKELSLIAGFPTLHVLLVNPAFLLASRIFSPHACSSVFALAFHLFTLAAKHKINK
jgi:hypothetical protein